MSVIFGFTSSSINCFGGSQSKTINTGVALDPNTKAGPLGVGTNQWISGKAGASYGVYFGNETTASASAQTVSVTDGLDQNLDLNSLSLTSIAIGNMNIPISPTFNPAVGLDEVVASVDCVRCRVYLYKSMQN